jgi:hypothetical protein
MEKYLEQRVEELELEVKLLKAKIKLDETQNTSKYLNNYSNYNPVKDYIYNSSINLMSEPDLETAFPSPFDQSNFEKNSLDTISFKQVSNLDSFTPQYPEILGSWDDDLPKNLNDDRPYITWGYESEFDKMDSDFLNWTKTDDAKEAYRKSISSIK